MTHVCGEVLHHDCVAAHVPRAGRDHMRLWVLPHPCLERPSPRHPDLFGQTLPFAPTRQVDDHDASYVRSPKGAWFQVSPLGVQQIHIPFEPDAVINGVALRVDSGDVHSYTLVPPRGGTEGALKFGGQTYVRENVRVSTDLYDNETGSSWTGLRIANVAFSVVAKSVCDNVLMPLRYTPAAASEEKESTWRDFIPLYFADEPTSDPSVEPFRTWITAFAICARGRTGDVLRLDATWQLLHSVVAWLAQATGRRRLVADARVNWLIFLLKQEQPARATVELCSATQLEQLSNDRIAFRVDPSVAQAFERFVNACQEAYPFPEDMGVQERFAHASLVDVDNHFLYLPGLGRVGQAGGFAAPGGPYAAGRDLDCDWDNKATSKLVFSVAATVAVLHLYRNEAWLRALECEFLRPDAVPSAELRRYGSILARLKMPNAAQLPVARLRLTALFNEAFRLLQTSRDTGTQPRSTFQLAWELVHELLKVRLTRNFIESHVREFSDAPGARTADLAQPRNSVWCKTCKQMEEPFDADSEPEDRVRHNYDRVPVLPDYALWKALGADMGCAPLVFKTESPGFLSLLSVQPYTVVIDKQRFMFSENSPYGLLF